MTISASHLTTKRYTRMSNVLLLVLQGSASLSIDVKVEIHIPGSPCLHNTNATQGKCKESVAVKNSIVQQLCTTAGGCYHLGAWSWVGGGIVALRVPHRREKHATAHVCTRLGVRSASRLCPLPCPPPPPAP